MAVPGASGNVDLLRRAHNKNVALGERAVTSDFVMTILEFPQIEVLFRAGQLPEEKRGDPVEDQGQYGQGFRQYGAVKRDGDITGQLVETKRGDVLGVISQIVDSKRYVTINIMLHGENTTMKGYSLQNCVIGAEMADLDTENRTGALRIPITIAYNWFERINIGLISV